MVGQIARYRELASVQRRVANSVDPVARGELQRDEVAARAADDDLALDDVHASDEDTADAARGYRVAVTCVRRRR